MEDRTDTLQQYVSDMLAVEEHIRQAIERQVDDGRLKDHPQARETVHEIQQMTTTHTNALKRRLTALGGDEASPAKEALTSILGVAAGLIDKVRPETVSKMLRDDYTALSLAAISYTMLHTTGLALKDEETANLALRHLKDITPVITKLSKVTPDVVAKELVNKVPSVDTGVVDRATENTQDAWKSEHVHGGDVQRPGVR